MPDDNGDLLERGKGAMKRLLIIALTVSLLIGIALPAKGASDTPKRGGTLTMAISKRMKLMNPLIRTSSTEGRIRALMFEPILGIDLQGKIHPHLAESWKVASDGLLYTFKLRKGVKFHNGEEMTAEDIKFAIDYTLNPKNGAYGHKDLKLVDRVEAPDRYTVKVYLKNPNPVFLTSLTSIQAFSAIPKGSLQEGVRKTTKFPPGTGPFKFGEWQPGQYITFERFDDYWGHKAFVDKVILRTLANPTVRFTALRAGDVDIVERTPYEWIRQVVEGKTEGIGIAKAPLAGARKLQFNVADPPFNNKKLRLAVAHAIDRKEILQAAYLGLAVTSDQRFPKGHVWYFEEAPSPPYDLDKAKALLKEAGYKGEAIELMGSRGDAVEIEGTAIQAQLKKIGMKVELAILERGTNLDRRRKGQFHFRMSGGRFYADPVFAYNSFLCEKDLRKRIANDSGYCDKEFDAMLAKAEKEVNPQNRKALFRKVVRKIISEDLPILAIGFSPRFFTFRNHVKDFVTDNNGSFLWWGGGLHHAWIGK